MVTVTMVITVTVTVVVLRRRAAPARGLGQVDADGLDPARILGTEGQFRLERRHDVFPMNRFPFPLPREYAMAGRGALGHCFRTKCCNFANLI